MHRHNIFILISRSRSRFLASYLNLHLVLCMLYIFPFRGVGASRIKGNHAYDALTLDKNPSLAHSKLQTLAQQTCSSKEYVTETLGCREGWDPIGRGCFLRIIKGMRWREAKARCIQLKSTLAKFDNPQDILTYLGHDKPVYDWIGLYTDETTQDKTQFKWLDGTKPTYDYWIPGQPNAYEDDDATTLERIGFRDKGGDRYWHYGICRHEPPSDSADKRIREKWNISSEPEDTEEFFAGSTITIICEGYYRPGEEPFIKVEKTKGPTTKIYFHEHIYAPKERVYKVWAYMDSKVPKAIEERIQSRNIKGRNRFIMHEGRCIRQSTPNVTFSFDEPFAESRLQCCHRYDAREFDCSSWLNTPKLKYRAWKPQITLSPPPTDKGLWSGQTVRCACTATTYPGTLLSAAVITHANCFNWVVSVDGASKKVVKHGILKECDISVDLSTIRKRVDFKGNNVFYEVTLNISEALDGAVCACYTYNVSSRTNLIDQDDELQSVSEPFRIIYPPTKPILRVAYHAQPNIVWRGDFLEATCSANLGTEGGDTMMEFVANKKTHQFDPRNVTEDIHLPGVGTLYINHGNVSLLCHLGWRAFADAGDCLWVSVKALGWWEARQVCNKMDADLVIIPDRIANEFIAGLLNADRFWIYGQAELTDSRYYFWPAGAQKDPYANWNSNGSRPRANTQDCVYIMEGEWGYTTCNNKFRFVCEKRPEPEDPTSPQVVKNYGEVFMTKIAIQVNDSLEGASLGCGTFLKSPEYSFQIKSEDLKVQYGPKAPFMTVSLTEIEGQKFVKMHCAALVGDGGFLSFAVVDADTIRYLYIINTTYGVIKEEPSPDVTIDKITVLTPEGKNPRISVRVTMKLTHHNWKPRMYCDSRKLNMDSWIWRKKLSSLLRDDSSGGGTGLALLAVIAGATLCIVLFKKKESSGLEEGRMAAKALSTVQAGEATDGEAHQPHDEAHQPPDEAHQPHDEAHQPHDELKSGEKSHEGASQGEKSGSDGPSVYHNDDT